MGEALLRQRRFVRAAIGALVLLVASATTAVAQFDRGTISGTIKDAQGGVVPGATVTATSTQTQQVRTTVTDGSGFYTLPNLSARPLRHRRRAAGLQESESAPASSSTPRRRFNLDFTLETGALTEEVTVTAEASAAADRRRGAQDDRGQGHRAAVVPRPQPDRRARAQGRRHRRQLQQRRRHVAHQRRLQHQRRPRRREQHLRRRRGRDPHPFGRRDHRRAERRRGPGSPGADRQLHARVRARQRRPDPVRHQERQQPLHPATRRSSMRDEALQANTWARNRSTERARRTRARRRSTTSSTATRSAARSRSACSRTSCSSSARRSGSTSSRSRPTPRPCRPRRCAAATSASCSEPNNVLQHARRSSATR